MNIAVLCAEPDNIKIRKYLDIYNMKCDTENEIRIFETTEDFLKDIKSECAYNLVFIDLETDRELQSASYIRKELFDESVDIIFMSSSEKCSGEIVKLHAFDYLIYPLNYNIVSKCINDYLRKTSRTFNVFRYISNKSRMEIVVSKIIYLHGNGRKTIMHTKKGETEFYRKLSDCSEEKCFSSFLDIHKSFLVNPIYIERVEGKYIILKGNEQLPISRQKLKSIEEYFEINNNKAEKNSDI